MDMKKRVYKELITREFRGFVLSEACRLRRNVGTPLNWAHMDTPLGATVVSMVKAGLGFDSTPEHPLPSRKALKRFENGIYNRVMKRMASRIVASANHGRFLKAVRAEDFLTAAYINTKRR